MVEWCNRKVERFKAENRNRKAEAPKKNLRGKPETGKDPISELF